MGLTSHRTFAAELAQMPQPSRIRTFGPRAGSRLAGACSGWGKLLEGGKAQRNVGWDVGHQNLWDWHIQVRGCLYQLLG